MHGDINVIVMSVASCRYLIRMFHVIYDLCDFAGILLSITELRAIYYDSNAMHYGIMEPPPLLSQNFPRSIPLGTAFCTGAYTKISFELKELI